MSVIINCGFFAYAYTVYTQLMSLPKFSNHLLHNSFEKKNYRAEISEIGYIIIIIITFFSWWGLTWWNHFQGTMPWFALFLHCFFPLFLIVTSFRFLTKFSWSTKFCRATDYTQSCQMKKTWSVTYWKQNSR